MAMVYLVNMTVSRLVDIGFLTSVVRLQHELHAVTKTFFENCCDTVINESLGATRQEEKLNGEFFQESNL